MPRVLTAFFLIVISVPLLGNLAGIDGADSYEEHRAFAVFPSPDTLRRDPLTYANAVSTWFADHFAFKSHLVRWYGASRFFGLRQSPNPSVALGKDGWLFYLDDRSLEDYINQTPLTRSDENGWRQIITDECRWLSERGIAFVFTVAPDKHVIYPEAFPSSVRPLRDVSRTDQLFGALEDTQVASVDVRPALLEAKARERVYFKTDTHWNDRGAYIAYQKIIEAIRAQDPNVPPAWPRSDFEEVSDETAGLDLSGMMGLRRVLRETDLKLVPRRQRQARVVEPSGAAMRDEVGHLVTEIPGSTLPRAVIFRDSFGSELVPFLSEHFSRAVYLWQQYLDHGAVMVEKPDVVIHEVVGRYIWSFSEIAGQKDER